MALPANFLAALARPHARVDFFLEIDGMEWAYGTVERGFAFFNNREDEDHLLGVKPWVMAESGRPVAPDIDAIELDHVEGRAEMGSARIAIVDVDDSLVGITAGRRRDGIAYLSADLDASATDFSASEDSDLTGWPTSGVLYIDDEAIRFDRVGNDFLSVTRGAYGTIAATHLAGAIDPTTAERESGAEMTWYPRTILGRGARIRMGVDPAAVSGDADCVDLVSGVVTGVSWSAAGQALVLEISDDQSRLKRQILEPLRRDLYTTGGLVPVVQRLSVNTDGSVVLHVGAADTLRPVSDLADGDECILSAAGGIARFTRNEGLDDSHTIAFDFVENILGSDEGDPAGASVVPATILGGDDGEHPLLIALQLLTSRLGDVANGDHDTLLPAGSGLGIAVDRVDVDDIVRLANATPMRVRIPVVAPIDDAREFITAHLLRPFGFYLSVRLGGVISIGSVGHADQTVRDAAPTLTIDDVLRDPENGLPRIEGPRLDPDLVVRAIEWKASPYIDDGEVKTASTVTLNVLSTGAGDSGRTVEVECIALGNSGDYPRKLAGAWVARFGAAPLSFDVTVGLDWLDQDLGSLVSLDLAGFPSLASGTRGISSALVEVVGKRIDMKVGEVTLTLLQSGAAFDEVRFFAPSLELSANAAATTTIAVEENANSEAPLFDADAFAETDVVRILAGNFATRSTTRTIDAAPGDDSIELDAAMTANDLSTVEFADYTEATASQRLRGLFMADGNDARFSDDSAPHVWALR